MTQRTMLRSLRRRWGGIHEYRPISLSIAVNGQIVAFHDVQGEHSTLSARIEHPERAQFVEVFSEHDVRLALLPVEEMPPHGSSMKSQRVELSDDRWLELVLTFDGWGLIVKLPTSIRLSPSTSRKRRKSIPLLWKPTQGQDLKAYRKYLALCLG